MSSQEARSREKKDSGYPLMPTLILGIGLLVLLTVGSVLSLNWVTGRSIVQEFATRLIGRSLTLQELALRRHLDAAVHEANFIAEAIRSGRYSFEEPQLADFLAGTIAAAPQIGGLILAEPGGMTLRVVRGETATSYVQDRFDLTRDPQLLAVAEETAARRESYWGSPVYREVNRRTYLNYRVPIWQGERYLGFLAAAISTRALSDLTAELSDPPANLAFMLYGSDALLAHPLMTDGDGQRSAQQPLPRLTDFGDLVIEDLPALPPFAAAGIAPPAGADGRQAEIDGEAYFVFTREIGGYGTLSVTIGYYALARAVDAPLRIFYWATAIALGLLGASLIAAGLMAGAISRPIRRAASGAAAVGALDFDKVAPLGRSRFREINDLARSFNAMLDGLRAFGRYVPRSLVNRLVKEGRVGAGSEERELAIMFSDIAGFTSTCENMSAAEVAAFINHHLGLISACVEREGGTIDKFIGDAMMAFWGAPGRVDNPAESACRAALAIQRAIAADNAARVAQGLVPVRMRIGVHQGRVVVGDIGAPNRINYTIVGDAVNATQRLESLGKSVDPEAEAIVLISDRVAAALPPGFGLHDQGSHRVKGKAEALRVHRLVDGPGGEAGDVA